MLHVVEPHLNGLGGDVPIIAATADSGRPFVICGQGTAPAAATLEAFAALGLDTVPGTGLLPAVVPGAFGAWMDLLARYGTWTVRAVMTPALGYARDGYPLLPQAAATIARVADLFREHWTTSAELYLPGGVAPEPGARFANPALAATLERLAATADAHHDRDAGIEAARAAFYEGFVAEAIDVACTGPAVHDSSGRAHRGLLTGQDLARWRATEEEPVTAEVFGRTVAKTGPWGQGPPAPAAGRPRGPRPRRHDCRLGRAGARAVVESAKLAFADRDAWYGDPDHTDVPLTTLLSAAYADERRRLIGHEASDGLHPGSPMLASRGSLSSSSRASPTSVPRPAPPPRRRRADVHHPARRRLRDPGPVRRDPHGTRRHRPRRHLSPGRRRPLEQRRLRDPERWLAAELTDDRLARVRPAHPRADVLARAGAARHPPGPGRRPRTTLKERPRRSCSATATPSSLCVGTRAAIRQDQWQVPFLLRHLAFGQGIQEAIDAPSWHTTHLVSSFDPRVV